MEKFKVVLEIEAPDMVELEQATELDGYSWEIIEVKKMK